MCTEEGPALWSQFSPSIFIWVLGIELRSPGLHDSFYLMSPLLSPSRSTPTALASPGTLSPSHSPSTALASPGTLVGFVAAASVALTCIFVLFERTRD